MRKKIELTMNTQELVLLMSEGNPGALSVLMQMITQDPHGVFKILSLDDMNIRGEQIWIGYKDYCNGDLKSFNEAIDKRDLEMVTIINKESSCGEMAVTSGVSFERGKTPSQNRMLRQGRRF